MNRKITRSTVNEQQYSASEFPTSGFPLSYRRYCSGMLGRIHVGGFHWTVAGDKISGRSSGKFTFNRINTPLVSPVNAMQYNVYLPFRPLDRSFKKGVTPTKLNAMSANWSMPTVNTRYLVQCLINFLYQGTYSDTEVNNDNVEELFTIFYEALAGAGGRSLDTPIKMWFAEGDPDADHTWLDFLYAPMTDVPSGLVTMIVDTLSAGSSSDLYEQASKLYMADSLIDIKDYVVSLLGTLENPLSGNLTVAEFMNLWLTAILTPFVGRYSYYAEFGYNFVRPADIYKISHGLINKTKVSDDLFVQFLSAFDDTPQNEYPLRAMYAVWYELFRNVDLEPVSNDLPDWQEWSSTSIFDFANNNDANLMYLVYRIRSWEKDMFISAQIDDLSRHVYAPIYNSASDAVSYHIQDVNGLDTQSMQDTSSPENPSTMYKPSIYNLGYRDQLTDSDVTISCPVPANVNDVLSSLDSSFTSVYGLDLNTLRQSQMLERYLKRNYLFGDEYQDRMLAHYNSRVSDMRINKPEILSQSLNSYDMKQEVSNVSTEETKVGQRTATATIEVQGEEFTTFCEEFGIVISLICFMPRAMYDGMTPQLLCTKQIDLPLPEFAANNEEFGRKLEIAGTGLDTGYLGSGQDNKFMFGRYPAYHAWRSRVDEVGGMFLDELQDCTFRRFFGLFSDETTPKLNYFFIHCRPNLGMFEDKILYNCQVYGDLVNECFVERVLPTPVEQI